jgi:hypothetical protein
MKNQSKVLFILSLVVSILFSCETRNSKSEEKIKRLLETGKYFSDAGEYSNLTEYNSGGWFKCSASAIEIDKFIMSKNLTKFPIVFPDESKVSAGYFIQFAVPAHFNIALRNPSFRFRGRIDNYGIHGFYNALDGETLICLYGR